MMPTDEMDKKKIQVLVTFLLQQCYFLKKPTILERREIHVLECQRELSLTLWKNMEIKLKTWSTWMDNWIWHNRLEMANWYQVKEKEYSDWHEISKRKMISLFNWPPYEITAHCTGEVTMNLGITRDKNVHQKNKRLTETETRWDQKETWSLWTDQWPPYEIKAHRWLAVRWPWMGKVLNTPFSILLLLLFHPLPFPSPSPV